MLPGVSIRRATEADIPVIRDLAGRIWRECYPGIITPEQIEYMLGWMYSEERIRDELRLGIRYELVESESRPVGYLSTSRVEDSRALHLHKLYLAPELHGRGLGRELLEHVFEHARTAGLSLVQLNVNKANIRARRSYEKAGFIVESAVVNDIGGGFVMDDFVMRRAV
jgi:ribosomal protein S18 acetylase RimI-like enzyme